MDDLFTDQLSKKDQLYEWIKHQGRVKTSDVMRWGLDNLHTRADRDCRDLHSEGKVWRLRSDLKIMFYPRIHEDVWSIYEADR